MISEIIRKYIHSSMTYVGIVYKLYFDSSVVDGGWSSWIHGACSKTCGGGIRNATRICNNPIPSCGGLPCRGNSTHEEVCNKICCPGKTII